MITKKLLEKEIQLTKTINQDPYHSYLIEMGGTKEECYVSWSVYKVSVDDNESIDEAVLSYLDEQDPYIEGYTKWDQCSNFGLDHICDLQDMNDVAIIFQCIYQMAAEILQEKWNR